MRFLREAWQQYLGLAARLAPDRYRHHIESGRAIWIIGAITLAQLTLYAVIGLVVFQCVSSEFTSHETQGPAQPADAADQPSAGR